MEFECREKVQAEVGAVGLNGSMATGFANKIQKVTTIFLKVASKSTTLGPGRPQQGPNALK